MFFLKETTVPPNPGKISFDFRTEIHDK